MREMGVAGLDQSASMTTSENLCLLSACGSEIIYGKHGQESVHFFNRGQAQIEAELE